MLNYNVDRCNTTLLCITINKTTQVQLLVESKENARSQESQRYVDTAFVFDICILYTHSFVAKYNPAYRSN